MGIPSPQWMLLLGILLSGPAARWGVLERSKKIQSYLLQASVVCLGAGLSFHEVIQQGPQGLLLTGASIAAVFAVGFLLGRWFALDRPLELLITAGTAICGGSAIAALAPVLAAEGVALTIAMSVVFFLNAVAVFIFPWIGGVFELTQHQFGVFAALAIHDTSSVVAAASLYGTEALQVATTLKLTRALWIVPLVVVANFWVRRGEQGKLALPWFVLGFLAASVAFTFNEQLHHLRGEFVMAAKAGFSLTLFLVGLGFRWDKLKQVGARPFAFALGLWALVVVGSLVLATQAQAQVDVRARLLAARNGSEVLIDVREKNEVELGMLPGAIWFPLSLTETDHDWVIKLKKIAGARTVSLYCRSGNRSGIMQSKLLPHGINAHNLGGYEELRRLLENKE